METPIRASRKHRATNFMAISSVPGQPMGISSEDKGWLGVFPCIFGICMSGKVFRASTYRRLCIECICLVSWLHLGWMLCPRPKPLVSRDPLPAPGAKPDRKHQLPGDPIKQDLPDSDLHPPELIVVWADHQTLARSIPTAIARATPKQNQKKLRCSLRGLPNPACFDTVRTNLNTASIAVHDCSYFLQVGEESPRCTVMRVTYVVSRHGFFSTNLANSGHLLLR